MTIKPQYLFSIEDSFGLTKTLGEIVLCRDAQGRAQYTVGNTAIVFRICHEGKQKALRCYRKPHPRLKMIYGEELLEQELFLFTTRDQGFWVDLVLTDWIEGEELRVAIDRAARNHDIGQIAALSDAFDHLALDLLLDDWAHGDLKPENILLTHDGALRLIDRDARFLPAMRGLEAIELGTPFYQHPTRSLHDFDERIDDYPIALIATALHALRMDPTLYDRFGQRDGLLFHPPTIERDDAYHAAMQVLNRSGHPTWIAIGELLGSPSLRIPRLKALFAARSDNGYDKIEASTYASFDF